MWENSNSLCSPVSPTGEYTCLFLFFLACQNSLSEEVGGGVHCVSSPKKTLVIIQNMGLSETCVHELDEKADSCLIWPAWVSCKSVPHWTPKKDMLFYLSASSVIYTWLRPAQLKLEHLINKKGHRLVSPWSPLRTTRIREQVSVIGNIIEYCTYISNRWSDF